MRLIRCFSSVFPGMTAEELREARAGKLSQWDSLAAITLAAVVQETFNVEIDLLNAAELDSFEAYLSYLGNGSFAADSGSRL